MAVRVPPWCTSAVCVYVLEPCVLALSRVQVRCDSPVYNWLNNCRQLLTARVVGLLPYTRVITATGSSYVTPMGSPRHDGQSEAIISMTSRGFQGCIMVR